MLIQTKAYFLIGLFLITSLLYGQNQKISDSATAIFKSGKHEGNELEILRTIAENETNPDTGIYYSNLLIAKASRDSLFDYLQYGYLQKGNNLKVKADLTHALSAYFESMKFSRKLNDNVKIGAVSISIADTYSILENFENADKYYEEGIEILRKENDSRKLATALLNFGDALFKNKMYDRALSNFEESGKIFNHIEHFIGKAYNVGNIGMVYVKQGKNEEAFEKLTKAISMLEERQDFSPISVYLTYLADIYAERNDYRNAFASARRSLQLAKSYGLKKEVGDANFKLAELYEQTSDFENAYHHYKYYILYRDSINNLETVRKMADLRTNFEVAQMETLVIQQKKLKNIIIIATAIALTLLGMLAIGLLRRYNFIRRTSLLIEKERNRSDHLLRNILPEETAKELKEHGKVTAKRFESISVLFTDFKGFTAHAEHLSPEDLVKGVDFYFSKFDKIMEKHGIEKIKTVGDSYMCAAGLHLHAHDHAQSLIKAAMEILEFVDSAKLNNPENHPRFETRIGISSGPVVAGVVGSKKFAYDIWGDTVNIASRMELHSQVGKINISDDTYVLVQENFECSFRGEIDVKNKGSMKMYFVDGIINEDQFAKSEKEKVIKIDPSGKFVNIQS